MTTDQIDNLTHATARSVERLLPEGCGVIVLVIDTRNEAAKLHCAHSTGDLLGTLLEAAAIIHSREDGDDDDDDND